ncbi:hypothetical protein MKW94_018007, partial [Papaver nudicaule]|nr:hypothetical protein [Papaver nudicaule]MCL7045062.1 hypothetical protein [Papaver nudicaule]
MFYTSEIASLLIVTLISLCPTFSKRSVSVTSRVVGRLRIQSMTVQCLNQESRTESASPIEHEDQTSLMKRRDMMGLALSKSSLVMASSDAKGAGLPPEEKPRLCDAACEKELENVPMVTTESGLQYKDIKLGRGPNPPPGFQDPFRICASQAKNSLTNGSIFVHFIKYSASFFYTFGLSSGL